VTLDTYFLYLAALGVFFATPPDTSQLLIMSNSLRHGRRRSLWTVAGDLSANMLQMTAAAFGLATLIAVSAEALTAVKRLGVAYLAWIGLSLLLTRPAPDRLPPPAGNGTLFRQGFLTSSANPYAVLFFGALFPQFIDPGRPILPQLLALGLTYLAVDGTILVAWGWTATRALGRLGGCGGAWLNRVCGALMVAAAALLASKDLALARDAAR
jgi:threonine/homoserine/homoserine lactone efflux protein